MERRSLPGRRILVAIGTIATVALVSSSAVAAPAGAAKAAKPAAAGSVKKKPGKPKPSQPTGPGPLTSESLGLGDTPSLSSIMTSQAPGDAAAAPAPAPASPPEQAPPPTPVEPEPSPAPTVLLVGGAARDKASDAPHAHVRHLTIALNPLPIAGGRYGMDLQLVFATHHAIVASGYYQTFTSQTLRVLMPKAVDLSHLPDAKPGGELGYRWYSGERGANGLFIGASGVVMPLALPRINDTLHSEVVAFHAFGGAVDVGAQLITNGGFTLGGGLGAMYLAYEPPVSTSAPGTPELKYTAPHVLPRVLLAAGWSF